MSLSASPAEAKEATHATGITRVLLIVAGLAIFVATAIGPELVSNLIDGVDSARTEPTCLQDAIGGDRSPETAAALDLVIANADVSCEPRPAP